MLTDHQPPAPALYECSGFIKFQCRRVTGASQCPAPAPLSTIPAAGRQKAPFPKCRPGSTFHTLMNCIIRGEQKPGKPLHLHLHPSQPLTKCNSAQNPSSASDAAPVYCVPGFIVGMRRGQHPNLQGGKMMCLCLIVAKFCNLCSSDQR